MLTMNVFVFCNMSKKMKQFQRYVVAWFAMIAEFIFTIYKKLRSFHHAGNILVTHHSDTN